jgi:signal transduction histidine kinase
MQTYEHERTQVARELKDDLCQRMTMLTMRLHEFSQAPGGGDQGEIRKGVEELKQQVASLAGDTFAISDQLHSSKLDLGLVSATRMHCNELSAHHGVAIDVRDQDVPSDLPEEVALALFRVMQEALHNTMKHAAAHSVIVSLRGAPNEMQLAVADDGIGFDPDAVMTDRALGLIGMRERLNLVDGECAIESRPGAGTRMCARVPLRQNLH